MIERGRLSEATALLDSFKSPDSKRTITLKHEDRLTAPLISSYTGLIAHLTGRYDDAVDHLKDAITGARDTEQQRAQAVSLIRLAAVHFGRGRVEAGKRIIRDGIAIAENGRQMDIVWRARITGCAGLDSKSQHRQIEETVAGALRYADQMATPRLKVQALRLQGDHCLVLGDIDGAAKATAAAMATAVRQGMVLQRIGLRVQMGRILLKRDDPSGRHLLDRAATLADRIGYQLMVERALSALDSPVQDAL